MLGLSGKRASREKRPSAGLIKLRRNNMRTEIPLWEKSNLTLEEASIYFNIGVNKLRELSSSDDCPFVLWVGNKRLIKRRVFEKELEKLYSI